MTYVCSRNVENKIFINYAVCKFLSRIILKKLNVDSLTTFRKVEKILKKIIKIKADIKYLKETIVRSFPLYYRNGILDFSLVVYISNG